MNGSHIAIPFLTQQNRRIAGDIILENEVITAEEKHVIIIGGGDTPGINRHLIQH
jgi:glutamate synthase (NADPH/NADH) small chain